MNRQHGRCPPAPGASQRHVVVGALPDLGADIKRAIAWIGTITVAMLLAACAAGVDRAPDPVEPDLPPVSQFQQWLDGSDIDFVVPQSGKAILVNIPAFELIAFDDGTPVLRSRAIVGTPYNQTPILETYTTAVRFRPTWRPTPDMIASGEYVDRRWPAGPDNPLGLAAIRLEPGLLVYLHDTNRRDLFAERARALSHGCVRVERWDALAAWVLDVDLESVRSWANGGRTFDQPTPQIPVFLGYFTRFPDDRGHVRDYDDIYRRNPATAVERLSDQQAATCPAQAPVAPQDGCLC